MRVIIFQSGDYGEAYRRFQAGGAETYRDQRLTVNFVAALAPEHEMVIVSACDRSSDEALAPGLRAIAIRHHQAWDASELWPLFDQFHADAFICQTPNRIALAWAANHRVPTLPVFADTFTTKGLRNRLNNWRLGRVLNRCVRPCVANHSLSASQSLSRLGLAADEIVPWEFHRLKPLVECKKAPPSDRPFRLFFAGALLESKGVGDCIRAVAIATAAHTKVELSLAGDGDVDRWTSYARRLGVESHVRMLGVIAAEGVLDEMRKNDAVIVASRHDYAEGLPNTIFEALASRTPLIASDHPAFVRRLRPAIDSLRFKAGHPHRLAEQVERLIHEPELYNRLSRESASALSRLYVGIEWSDLVSQFVEDPLSNRNWVKGYTLADQPNLIEQRRHIELLAPL